MSSEATTVKTITFIGWIRAVVRIVLLLAVLLLYIPYFIGWLLLSPWPDRAYRYKCSIIMLWAKAWCAILGMRVTQHGSPPPLPFILVSNHLGYLDILLLQCVVPAWFVSKADVRGWPLIGMMTRSGHVLFINRGRKRDVQRINERMAEILERKQGVLFFPEGTSHRGDEVHPLKTSLLAIANNSGHPVHTAVISYRTEPGDPPPSEVLCWWGDHEFAPHFLRLLTLRRFHATLHFPPEPAQNPDRKALGVDLQQKMNEVFTPNA